MIAPTDRTLPVVPISLAAGDAMPQSSVGPLTRTDFVRYAGAGGDLNPIHHDEPLAQSLGLPSVFGMGMLHAGMLGTRLAGWVGPGNIESYRVRFTGQVWPGDTLTFKGRVERLEGSTAVIEMEVERQTGEAALRASAVVRRA
jgi:acyl dehydratase